MNPQPAAVVVPERTLQALRVRLLTSRELEVLQLVADGLTDKAIGDRLDRNDPTTCGICSPAIGQPPPRGALAAVLAPTAHANLDDAIYDDDRPVHDVTAKGGQL